MREFDVIIIGGGVAGLSLALSLSETTLKIAVLEAREFQLTKFGCHSRVSAYNLASQKLFTQLNVWQRIAADCKSPFQHIEVWDDSGNGEVKFDCFDIAQPALGHIIQNEAVIKALRSEIETKSNIQLFCPMPAQCVQFREQVQVVVEEGVIAGKLIVGADGANSWLREQLKVPMTQAPYGSSALIANVRLEKPHNKTARQVFLANGPLAFLPLKTSDQCSIVWSTTPEQAQELQQLDADNFCGQLSTVAGARVGRVAARLDQPMVFPLLMRHVHNYVGPRWALVGDAAHTIHPLAGQGINLGLQDVQALADTIKTSIQQGRDIGLKQNLRSYERTRKGDNQLMISAMQGFKTLFGTDQPLVKSARNAGFNLVNTSRLMKRFFMQMASGAQS